MGGEWKLVPVEPTKEMVLAGETAIENATDQVWDSTSDEMYGGLNSGAQTDVYSAMLAASPPPPSGAAWGDIETDPTDPTRAYIPLPGGWEIQTKGKGSSFRLCNTKTGDRFPILDGDRIGQSFMEKMGREVHAAASALTPAPSYAEGLEAAALHVEKRLDAYMADHGVYDPLLGGLMEDIRELAGKPPVTP